MGVLIWKEIASKWGKDPKAIVERSWQSLRGRFLGHIMATLKEKDKENLVAADKRAKEERLAKTGRTWADLYYTTEEDEEILEYIVEKQQYSRVGGKALF